MEQLAVMTCDAQQFGKEVRRLRRPLTNALTLAAKAAGAAPQAPEDRDKQLPYSPDYSVSNQTLLRISITQLRMVI